MPYKRLIPAAVVVMVVTDVVVPDVLAVVCVAIVVLTTTCTPFITCSAVVLQCYRRHVIAILSNAKVDPL